MKAHYILVGFIITLLMNYPARLYAHDEQPLFNQVHLQAQSEGHIPNNQMTVILAAEHQGEDASNVAATVNQEMDWAASIIQTHTEIESKTTGYQTYPAYNKQIVIGWRVTQQLELRSVNIESLTDLVGKLQEKLKVKQITFNPTDVSRKKFEDQLIEEAMMAFKHRIEIIKKHMENKNHRIISINVNTGNYHPPVPHQSTRMSTMAQEMKTAPALDAGTSRISVTVNGSVQFFQ